NLKFISKGETNEVFGMAIPKQLITQAIQQSSYYPKYLEMVAKNTKKTPQDSASKQPEPATKRAPPKKPTTTTPVKPTKPPSSKQPKSLTKKPSKPIKLSLDPSFLPQGRAPVGGVTIRDPVSETTPKLPEVVGKGKAIVTEEQVAHSLIDLSKKKRTTDQFILAGSDPEKAHEALAGPNPEPMQEDQIRSNSGKVHVPLARPNPEHMDDEFLAIAYPKVHENLKLITDNVITPLINTEATSITTTLPEINPFIALQLRVAKLEQDMFEVKKTNHSAAILASIKSQVPTAVEKYLGTKLDDA
ncbi:hypothetical protein Tco_0751267, partial [Tanacetum coccineum]